MMQWMPNGKKFVPQSQAIQKKRPVEYSSANEISCCPGKAFTSTELIFHAVVRNIRSRHFNANMANVFNILQMAVVATAYNFILAFPGTCVAKIRREFVLYLLSGVFLFITHIKSVGVISSVGSDQNPMKLHSPMNMMLMLFVAAFGTCHAQFASILLILFTYSVSVASLETQEPGGTIAATLAFAWLTGCAAGLVFLALKSWIPNTIAILNKVYHRLIKVLSGKMFVANVLVGMMLTLFAWNSLFHIIDQCHSFAFRNLSPHDTSWEYALRVGITQAMIGFLAELYT